MTSLTVPATLEALGPIGAFVAEAAAAAGLSRQAGYRLRLAADELATNAATHGQAGAAVPGTIELRAEVSDTALTLVLEDTGIPFDPRQVPPPGDLDLPPEQRQLGGLGIYLALTGVDHYSYERVGVRNRNSLVVNRPAPGG
jgi:anti-sigma regulatory factor (Ser/Thr protein kinase)